MMKITNEDKIVLLEFLGYSIYNRAVFDSYNHYLEQVDIYMSEFNPLDISILMKVLDIIEKEYETVLIYHPTNSYHFTIHKTDKGLFIGEGSTREEAILSALLAYTKLPK